MNADVNADPFWLLVACEPFANFWTANSRTPIDRNSSVNSRNAIKYDPNVSTNHI
jgi:hypothetical protein